MPEGVKALESKDIGLTLTEYRKFWTKAKEDTACYPDALSFSTMKVGATSEYIAAIEHALVSIPLISGYSPRWWKNFLDVLILKKSGAKHLNSLQTIVLFPVDCNFAFKHVGRKMMKIAELSNSLAPEQYGSRRHHRAIDLAVNKTLTFDILCQLKRPGTICSNNAKSCYDLIGHTQASIAMQRMGVPRAFVDCLFTTLQEGIHSVRPAYGDSKKTYGGKALGIPIHGIYQGNGAGPAIWAVLSSPLLDLMRNKGFGLLLFTPISKTNVSFVGYAFVDDTDLIQILDIDKSSKEVRQKLQKAIDTWEQALSATCGAIVPEKTRWCLIDFTWKNGHWSYKAIDNCQGQLSAKDITRSRKVLTRVSVDQAKETLGVFLAPNGDTGTQALHMEEKAKDWVTQMRAGNLSRQELWTSLCSTIMPTLTYPLPASNLTKKQCEKILSILLNYALPA
jgi:hypothetical protein